MPAVAVRQPSSAGRAGSSRPPSRHHGQRQASAADMSVASRRGYC